MPPKQSKKSVQKEQAKKIEDKTFGLKNKNRSTKVQQYCENVAGSVKSGNRMTVRSDAEIDARRKAKEEKRAFEEAMKKMGMDTGGKKKKPTVEELLAMSDSDDDEEDDKQLGVAPEDYLWTADDFDEVAHDAARMEEMLEAEREKLKDRTDLTPVTEETFRAWREKKKAEKAEKERKRLDAAKAGKSKMRGWDLWTTKQDLFVDDEDGEEAYTKEFDDAALFEDDEEAGEGDFDLGDEGDGAAAAAAASGDKKKEDGDKKEDEDEEEDDDGDK